ncbi:MAG: biotin/lipoyl-binding protein [Selenomonadaceae bacterium]|nr:biotin/lipoyl-binding protein [Selenomonadaceae bacterium]
MAEDGSKIFSREALEKLRSPEKLDTLLPITTPLTWMALSAVVLLLFSVVVWSIFGSFTEKADGMGMIMDSAGVVNVSHIRGGKVTEIYIHKGSHVNAGDVIARVEHLEQAADTQIARHAPELAENKREMTERVYQSDSKEYQENIIEEVKSNYPGVVDRVFIRNGNIINGGTPVCTIRLTEKRDDLTGVLYIPVEKGKRVKPGQTIQLAPNGVDVALSGSLIGIVRSVSEYPVSLQDVEYTLGNPQLSQMIMASGNGGIMEIVFDLVKDKNSESGYLWTTFVGEHKEISAGSFCTGSIIIDRRPPIEKVFYNLSQWLRNR